jgi:hypothetical protein
MYNWESDSQKYGLIDNQGIVDAAVVGDAPKAEGRYRSDGGG